MPDRSYIDAQAGDTSAVNLRYVVCAVQVYIIHCSLWTKVIRYFWDFVLDFCSESAQTSYISLLFRS